MNTIETERLIVRRFEESDGQDLFEYLSDPEVVKTEPYEPFDLDAAKGEAIRRAGDETFFAVVLKSGKLIGNLYLAKGEFDTWELGYVFNRNFWKNGYAYESAKALVSYIFERENARRVIAMCNPKNPNSWHLLEHLGLRREGCLKQNIYFKKDENGDPIWLDTFEYGVLKEEWK